MSQFALVVLEATLASTAVFAAAVLAAVCADSLIKRFHRTS